MVKVRPQTIMAGHTKVGPMANTGAKSMQIVGSGNMTWSKKGAFLRNTPYTAENPHRGQRQQRIAFGRAAQAARGTRGVNPQNGLPGAAGVIAGHHFGRQSGSMSEDAYPSKIRSSFNTLAELEAAEARESGVSRSGSLPPRAPSGRFISRRQM